MLLASLTLCAGCAETPKPPLVVVRPSLGEIPPFCDPNPLPQIRSNDARVLLGDATKSLVETRANQVECKEWLNGIREREDDGQS